MMDSELAVLATGRSVGGLVGQAGSDEHSDLGRLSIEDLYRTDYAASVRLAGLLLGDFFAGEEIAQDAFARLVDAANVRDPAAYLRATVVNLSRSRIRRAIVARRYRPPPPQDAPGPEDDTDSVAVRTALRRELQRLPRRQREAVVLRFYAGLTDAEIAEAMGVSKGSVKTHMHRALTALSERMEALR